MMGYGEHQRAGRSIVARCAVITLSDTRDETSDRSGGRIRQMLEEAGHQVIFYQVIPDDSGRLDALLGELEARADIHAILTNGGTGISSRDQTVPVIRRHLTSPLDGFGELFRMLSYEQIGSAAMLSRAIGGVAKGKLLFAMPGSTKAVELAMSRLILPELGHLLSELGK